MSPTLISKDTNNTFGRSIDAHLERALAFVRVPLDLLSGEGDPPHDILGLQLPDNRTVSIDPGGRLHLPSIPRFEEIDGQLHVGGQIYSIPELMKLGKKFFTKYNITEGDIRNEAEIRHEYLPRANFQFTIDPEALRCVAKMACNLFAHHERDLFLRSDFDGIRKLVGVGGNPYVHLSFAAEAIAIGAWTVRQ